MFTLSIENNKLERIQLTNSKFYEITNITGLVLTNVTINRNIVPGTDGERFNSSRVEPRNIVLTIKIKGNVEQNRIKLYQYLKLKEKIKIYYQNNTRNVYIEGYIENIDADLFTLNQEINVSVLCLHPYFRAVNQSVFDVAQVISMFEFPFSIESEGIEFSVYDKTLLVPITNNGDVSTGVTMELKAIGEVINPVIYNTDNREHFKLNFTMLLGDLITINTTKGEKSITLFRNGLSSNIINHVDSTSTWFEINPGDSLFTYECDDGNEYFSIRVLLDNCFEGV